MTLRRIAAAIALVAASCGKPAPADRPNVLWIVWDTVRADRLSLYGHGAPTTPHLERFAAGARVFDDCRAPSGTTLPSHASMFTGLLPGEHGANNAHRFLDDTHETFAETLRAHGWRTYLFSANPNVSASRNLAQGFEVAEHPWDDRHRERARALVRARRAEAPRGRRPRGEHAQWNLKDAGALVPEAVLAWLGAGDGRPWFVFVNYMEAHQPLMPPRRFRARFLDAGAVERSWAVDRSWEAVWAYTFGLREYSDEELALTAATYDAAVAELDENTHGLLEALAAGGWLDDTIVVITSDHGEHLGEHHRLDHQYSLYEPLLRVPLVLRWPGGVPAGREPRPVSLEDLHPTLLALAGIPAPPNPAPHAVDLLAPLPARERLAAYPAALEGPIETIAALHPEFDPAPWRRSLRAFVAPPLKYVWASDGREELYDLAADPGERNDLHDARPGDTARLRAALAERLATLRPPPVPGHAAPRPSRDLLRRLGALGYVEGGDDGR